MTEAEEAAKDPSLVTVLTEVLTEVQQMRRELRETQDRVETSREEFQRQIQTSREEFQRQIQKNREELQQEIKRWDERFFQLSRDTLNFTRTVVTTAAIVAVLIPLLKDVALLVIELLQTHP